MSNIKPVLTLPIKRKWFEMILSGKKKEEYREIKPYYNARFRNVFAAEQDSAKPVCFRNGYSAKSPSFIADCRLSIGIGNTDWGASANTTYYILHIEHIYGRIE